MSEALSKIIEVDPNTGALPESLIDEDEIIDILISVKQQQVSTNTGTIPAANNEQEEDKKSGIEDDMMIDENRQ
jgi:hypothetical protein